MKKLAVNQAVSYDIRSLPYDFEHFKLGKWIICVNYLHAQQKPGTEYELGRTLALPPVCWRGANRISKISDTNLLLHLEVRCENSFEWGSWGRTFHILATIIKFIYSYVLEVTIMSLAYERNYILSTISDALLLRCDVTNGYKRYNNIDCPTLLSLATPHGILSAYNIKSSVYLFDSKMPNLLWIARVYWANTTLMRRFILKV